MKTLAGKGIREIQQQNLKSEKFNSFYNKELNTVMHNLIIRGGETPPVAFPLMCHDDQLVLRGQKHAVGMSTNWKMKLAKGGKPTRYWNPETGDNLPPNGPIPPGYVACSPRIGQLFKDISIEAKDAYIDFRINTLWEDFRARYRICLEALEAAGDRGILEYRPRSFSNYSSGHRREAFRHKLKKVWYVSSYEHNLIIFDSHIGHTLLAELAPHCIAGGKYLPSTVYLNGYNPNTRPRPTKVFVYDMKPLHKTEAVKIEICLKDGYLKRQRVDGRNLRQADQFDQQPDIQKLIEDELRKWWTRILKKAPVATDLLMSRTSTSTIQEVVDYMADRSHTLTLLRRSHSI